MQYIKSADKEKGCLFCRVLAQKRDGENLVVLRGKKCFCMMNRFPYNGGHMMIVPKRHVGAIEDLGPAEMTELMQMTAKAKCVLDTLMKPEGFNIGINLGRVAGAGVVDHVHIHIVPRWNGDTNFMPVMSDTRVVPEALANVFKDLKNGLNCGTGGKSRGKRK
jgi:ATP adenylyltransferase